MRFESFDVVERKTQTQLIGWKMERHYYLPPKPLEEQPLRKMFNGKDLLL